MLRTLAARTTWKAPTRDALHVSSHHIPVASSGRAAHAQVPVVSGERRRRILAGLDDGTRDNVTAGRLCEVSSRMTGLAGAGIMLMAGELPIGPVATTGPISALIEDLQYTLGEGPCVDAYRLGRPVLEPDLADPVVPRWMAFTAPAVDAGARAIFGFPLGIGAVRLGALDLYADRPGPLTDDQYADGLILAELATQVVLAMHAGGSTDAWATELLQGSHLLHAVHQASGMVSSQLDVSVAEALIRLRAFAFGNQRPLADVAADVVARRLRFDDRN